MTTIIQWLLAATLAWVPILTPVKTMTSSRDLRAEIVRDVFEVTQDPNEQPLFQGDNAREKTALFLLAIASFESGFHPLVDSGRIKGDGGNSWCHMQILIGEGRTTEGWTGKDLIADRKKCFRAGLHILHTAKALCPYLKPADRFSAYAVGRCTSGLRAVRSRYERSSSWLKQTPIPSVQGAPTR